MWNGPSCRASASLRPSVGFQSCRAMLSIPPSREAPPPGTSAAVRGLQVRSGLWVPHPQDATVPPDGSVTRPSPTAPLSQDAAPGWPWWPFSLGLEPCPLWVAL